VLEAPLYAREAVSSGILYWFPAFFRFPNKATILVAPRNPACILARTWASYSLWRCRRPHLVLSEEQNENVLLAVVFHK
jgi:hypothetical protein